MAKGPSIRAFNLSRDLDYADVAPLRPQLEEVRKLLEGYIRQLSAAKANPEILTPEFRLLPPEVAYRIQIPR